MRTMLCVVWVVGVGCGGPATIARGQEPTRTPLKIGAPSGTLFGSGVIENGLTRDACAYPITIDGKTYSPSRSSEDQVKAFLGSASIKNADLAYRRTGYTAVVECGFDGFAQHPEIEILVLSPPCANTERLATTCEQCGAAGGCAKEKTACTPVCGAGAPCASGTCVDGVCSAAAACI